MTIPTEPIFGGEFPGRFKFWMMPRKPGEPKRIEGTATIVGDEWNLVMDGLVGPQGAPGQPASIIRRDYSLTDPGDLPSPGMLDESDWGRAWYIQGQWHIFDHDEYWVVEGSLPGPPGRTPDISISAEQIPMPMSGPYGEVEVVPGGTTEAPHFTLKIPGIPGDDGPAAAITLASDYDDDGTDAAVGDFLVRKSGNKWGPGRPDFLTPKIFTIPHNQFINHTGSEGRFLIAKYDLPAFNSPWYIDVTGHGRLARSGLFSSAQCEVEVRIGNTGSSTGDTEPLCGLAPYDPAVAMWDAATIFHIGPHYSDDVDPNRSITPDSSVGRNLPGQLKTVYVFVHKIGGAGAWEFTNNNAQLRIQVNPVQDD
ncbi:MAG: phage tail protein [Mycobacterium sp.]|nr:MAG: phage tail protein [Mycobacterium sp.]